MGDSFGLWDLTEALLPNLVKLLLCDESVVNYACLRIKRGGVTANSYFLVDFAHLPSELGFVEIREMVRDECDEDLAE